MPKSDYLLFNKLLYILLHSSKPISKSELATELGVSAKTVKRLKDSINEMQPIIEEINGVTGGYFINDHDLIEGLNVFSLKKSVNTADRPVDFVNYADVFATSFKLPDDNILMYAKLLSIISVLNKEDLSSLIAYGNNLLRSAPSIQAVNLKASDDKPSATKLNLVVNKYTEEEIQSINNDLQLIIKNGQGGVFSGDIFKTFYKYFKTVRDIRPRLYFIMKNGDGGRLEYRSELDAARAIINFSKRRFPWLYYNEIKWLILNNCYDDVSLLKKIVRKLNISFTDFDLFIKRDDTSFLTIEQLVSILDDFLFKAKVKDVSSLKIDKKFILVESSPSLWGKVERPIYRLPINTFFEDNPSSI